MRRVLPALLAVLLLLVPTLARADWPDYRGPTGDGHAAPAKDGKPHGLPLRWSETENVTWKTAIPHRGWSTPVVLGGQVWLTTATIQGNDFFAICVDAATGKVLFNERLFHSDSPEPLSNQVNCYASPTPVIEPGRVYVSFGSYGTACLDTATRKTLWTRTDLQCRHYRGPGSSPILFGNLLILSMDGVDVQYLVALDKATGRTVWKTPRSTKWTDLDSKGQPIREGDFRKSFGTPLVINAGGRPQMISLGSKATFAYDPRTGKELWKTHHAGHTSVVRPVFGNGIAYTTTGHGRTELWAIRVDGQGDVTDTHVAWKMRKDVPTTPSPLLVDGLLYVVSNQGALTCLDPATGKTVWRERLGGSYIASPICADGRLYFFSTQGKATVLKPGRTFEVLATSRLAGGFMASPATSGRALFLRTKTHLYRIEAPAAGK